MTDDLQNNSNQAGNKTSISNNGAKRQWNEMGRNNKLQILYTAKHLIKSKGKIKGFVYLQK